MTAPDPDPLAWQLRGACRDEDPELWFTVEPEARRAARAICASCPVWQACREYALVTREPHGIWGGLSPRQREDIRAGARRVAGSPALVLSASIAARRAAGESIAEIAADRRVTQEAIRRHLRRAAAATAAAAATT